MNTEVTMDTRTFDTEEDTQI